MTETQTQKHTPGPWECNPEIECTTSAHGFGPEPSRAIVRVVGDGGWDMTAAVPCGERGKANARLIAAAPDLLEACKLVDEWHDLVRQNYPEMLRPFEAARAAIAKAQP